MKKLTLSILFSMFVAAPAFAGTFAYNLDDTDFLISVKNETPHTCVLDDAYAIKGTDISIIRYSIPSNDTARFIVSHPLGNAHYKISYLCGNDQIGNKKITFQSKRNIGLYWAGYTRGKVLEEESHPNITAIITSKGRGSTTLYLNGYINWSIRYKSESK